MASKIIYTVAAIVGIAGASGAAWWYQNKPASTSGTDMAGAQPAASAPAAAASAPRAAVVEAAKVIENTHRDLNIALMNELAGSST